MLSPTAGMIAGAALIVSAVLMIALSLAAAADAVFSLLPPAWARFKVPFASSAVLVLALVNARGMKDFRSVAVPVLAVFFATHIAVIVSVLVQPGSGDALAAAATGRSWTGLGTVATLVLVAGAYGMSAGIYTGLEALGSLPVPGGPSAQAAPRTIGITATALAALVLGLTTAYILAPVLPQPGRTLNSVLIGAASRDWGLAGRAFVVVSLLSEAGLLLLAAQAGFLKGPKVLSLMALDRWVPTKLAMPSDRFVTRNALALMSLSALAAIMMTNGTVFSLVVLYGIAVFTTAVLAQLGLVLHWFRVRASEQKWLTELLISAFGLLLAIVILVSLLTGTFGSGGWVALLLIGGTAGATLFTRRHYRRTLQLLGRLDELVQAAGPSGGAADPAKIVKYDPRGKTAILLVNGFNGLGLHTLFNVMRLFGSVFRNFVFVQVGVLDGNTLQGSEVAARRQAEVNRDLERYVRYMQDHGYYAAGRAAFGLDVVDEIVRLTPEILERFPNAVLFGGQLVFPRTGFLSGLFHNYTIFSIQRRFYDQGIPIPVVVLPIRV
jgi:hypothetical protein